MLFFLFSNENIEPLVAVIDCAILIFVVLFALTIHEFAHALAAVKMGDITPKIHGRLTLNPFKHLDFMGFLCFLFLGIGWAKPVPINPINFKKYRTGMRWVSIVGILSNLLVALIATLIYGIIIANVTVVSTPLSYLLLALQFIMLVNSSLAMVNILPIFPLDGFNFITSFMKTDNKFIEFNAKHGYKVMVALLIIGVVTEILFGFDILSWYVSILYNYVLLPLSMIGV